ncbi:MAG: DEAD/DEAH box helicase [Candidatus Glassbacteria bacterium]|nr:DEAD/DEAH box helicase [Candidatus Glassbacteria bacterium]
MKKQSGRKAHPQRSVDEVVKKLESDKHFRSSIVHHRYLPATPARRSKPEPPLPGPLARALSISGIDELYSHQVEALQAVRAGRNVIVSTPTASGKTMIYNLPVVESCLKDPGARAIYLYPLKALEQDQRRKITELADACGGLSLSVEIYDGDTSAYRRKKIRAAPPNIILTNPDMLHLGILACHEGWEEFFRSLRYVVVDELHTYKGIFGAHFAGVLRRLRRVCGLYGSCPVFIASSATIANPGEFAELLFEVPFTVIERSGAPGSGRHFLFVNPQEVRPATLASRLIKLLVDSGLKTIVFTKARKTTELIHSWTIRSEHRLAGRISSYRSGYRPDERREIESRLAEDRLDAVISTSALEMGIDIGGLDACILVGYPGTVASTWQRGGRVGRRERDSLILLIAQQDALDQYFMRHPEDFFRRSVERALVDPDNEYVLRDHLECAAAEIPLGPGETVFDRGRYGKVIDSLKSSGRLLEEVQGGRLFAARSRPHRTVSLRAAGESFTILDSSSEPPEVVGSVGGARAPAECHAGAVYLHRARQYLVKRLDLEKRNIYVVPSGDPYYTQVQTSKDTEILEVVKSRPCGNFLIKYGRLKVTERITGFQKRSIGSQELLSSHPLELPPQVFETMGFWLEIPAAVQLAVSRAEGHFMGGLHAIEHASIAIFPLFVLCDRGDIGGICFTSHPQVGGPAIFIYDGYPGGVGIALGVYDKIDSLLESTRRLIADCECEAGCPSCVHSPKCGSGNKPLDKPSALLVLDLLLARVPLPVAGETRSGPASTEEPGPPAKEAGGLFPQDKKIYVLDIETQRLAEEVGGWANKHLMRLSVAVMQDLATGEMLTFTEADVDSLLEHLSAADLVVGFNLIDFDYQVMRAYGPFDFSRLNTFDILQDIHRRLGYRLSLGELGEKTLGVRKTADGLQAVEWFRLGEIEKIIQYCAADVRLTARLFEHGLREGYLEFDHKKQGRVRLSLDWDIDKILGG